MSLCRLGCDAVVFGCSVNVWQVGDGRITNLEVFHGLIELVVRIAYGSWEKPREAGWNSRCFGRNLNRAIPAYNSVPHCYVTHTFTILFLLPPTTSILKSALVFCRNTGDGLNVTVQWFEFILFLNIPDLSPGYGAGYFERVIESFFGL
jgi:hypothetical protein